MQTITPDEQMLLQRELMAGESILWSGKPEPKVIFHATDLYVIPFSLLWGGFSIFWELGVSGYGFMGDKHPASFMIFWGIPFVIVGQYLIWGRFFYAAWKKRRIIYAVTTRRVLVLVRPPQARTISSYLDSLPSLEKSVRADGIGTLSFGGLPPVISSGRNSKTAPMDGLYLNAGSPVFVDIDDANGVATIIDAQRQRSRNSSS